MGTSNALLTCGAMPAAAVPVAAVNGSVPRDHDLVPLADPDLVIATGAAVRLHGFVRLLVPIVDTVVLAAVEIGPVVRTHAPVTVSPRPDPAVHCGDTRGRWEPWTVCSSIETTES
ncbi:MAG: hypothetical protein QOI08_1403 [Actinomycetota bacterium]|nr:hypothetical protein [Actinomycetota bacterium]